MIPDYKLFHGAVLAEIVHDLAHPVTIDELTEDGRLSSYVLNHSVGVYIKHSSQRLRPWSFTFTPANLTELEQLRALCETVFVVFVGQQMGIVCLTWDEVSSVVGEGDSGQAWVRVDRPRGKQYSIFGTKGPLKSKKPYGVDCLLSELRPVSLESVAEPSSRTSERSRFSFSWLTRRPS